MGLAISQFKEDIVDKYTEDNYVQQEDGTYKSLINGVTSATLSGVMSQDQKDAQAKVEEDITATTFKTYQTRTETSADALSSYDTPEGNVRVDNYDLANKSITAIQNAINKVSGQRSALGALQNRLEHTVANLDNVSENTQAAESRIRDTDMAEEMVEYSKNNILAQAGQSMLAQANQSTQGVLSLLQ